jgi:hypothetical protein
VKLVQIYDLKKGHFARFEVLTAMLLNDVVVWNVAVPCWAYSGWWYGGVPRNVASHYFTSQVTGIYKH